MMKLDLGLLLVTVCMGCDPGTTTNNSPPKEPHTRDMKLVQPPPSDPILIVNSGWHPGKEFPLTQSLHANPVSKDKLANDLPTEYDRPVN